MKRLCFLCLIFCMALALLTACAPEQEDTEVSVRLENGEERPYGKAVDPAALLEALTG